jgi:NAD(P)-dependent dehydrogenase (short-subunit alcohol dehydrogenase family)
MKVDLNNKIALVTGGARGIGRAIASRLADNGAIVYVADIDIPDDPSLKSSALHPIRMDVTDENAVNEAFRTILVDHQRIDVVVNNAGINTLKHRTTIDQFPREEWDRLLNVDLTGLFIVSKAASAAMLQIGGGGRIINIASVVGLVPLRLQSAFAAAKAGVINLTRAMAIELGSRGILVNCVAPGSILTDATRQLFYGEDGLFKESVHRLMEHIPLKRPGTADEIAHAVCFLAAPESSYVNGAILTIDGGWTAGYTREF